MVCVFLVGLVEDLSGSLPAHIFQTGSLPAKYLQLLSPITYVAYILLYNTKASANIISKCSLFDIDIDPGAGGDLVGLIF